MKKCFRLFYLGIIEILGSLGVFYCGFCAVDAVMDISSAAGWRVVSLFIAALFMFAAAILLTFIMGYSSDHPSKFWVKEHTTKISDVDKIKEVKKMFEERNFKLDLNNETDKELDHLIDYIRSYEAARVFNLKK